MAESTNNSTEKVVTLEGLEAASEVLATKAEVKEQIAEVVTTCANITFATTEEVLALFGKKAPVTDPETSDGEA